MNKFFVFLFCLVSVSSFVAHAEPVEDCESLSSSPQNDKDVFERVRCSLGEDNGIYAREHKRVTLVVLPYFGDEDRQLVVLEAHPSVSVLRSGRRVGLLEKTELRFSQVSNPLGDFIFIDNNDPFKGAIFHDRLVRDLYSKSLDSARLEQVFYQLSASITEQGLVVGPWNDCISEKTVFVEIVNEGDSKLLKMHDCDERYVGFLKDLSPLIELAIEELLPLEDELNDLKANLFAP